MSKKIKIFFFTLGCKVNQYETQLIRESFNTENYQEVADYLAADIVIINSCTVTERSDQKTRKLIRSIKNHSPECTIVITGCYAQHGRETLEKMPEIDLIIDHPHKLQTSLFVEKSILNSPQEKHLSISQNIQQTISSLKERSRAYIKIQDGCQSFCSYCIIPFIRNKLQSKPPEIAIQELLNLIQNGTKEIVLLGIHLGQYGKDASYSWNLYTLLQNIVSLLNDRKNSFFRLRLSSLEMNEVNDSILDLMAQYAHIIVPHLHIPLQGGDDVLLQRMNRHYTTSEFANCCKKIRQYLPNPAITTDIIVGFPGETEEQFNNTMDFCRQIGFSKIHVFPYSDRKGTKAFEMANKVPENIKHERVRQLLELANQLQKSYFENFVGKVVNVLAEETIANSNNLIGVSEHYLKVIFPGKPEQIDQFVQVSIQKTAEDYLWGTI